MQRPPAKGTLPSLPTKIVVLDDTDTSSAIVSFLLQDHLKELKSATPHIMQQVLSHTPYVGRMTSFYSENNSCWPS